MSLGLPDPCRPGRECTAIAPFAETGPGAINVLDALSIVLQIVGLGDPIVGQIALPPTGTVTGVISSPQRGALAGVTVTASPTPATSSTAATGSYSVLAPAGSVTLTLGALPSGCTNTGPQVVTVVAEQTTTLNVSVTCPPNGPALLRIGAGDDHTCALTATGDAYCAGSNASGQLGDGTTITRATPIRVAAPAGVTFTQIATGLRNSCGLTAAGAGYC